MDPTQIPQTSHEAFTHVRVIIGLVTGLSIARLLTGLARFVQHPTRQRVYPVHIGWAIYMLFAALNFWWFEFDLRLLPVWTFGDYIFVLFYASMFFFTCTLLFPDTLEEYPGYEEYFHARQAWFFGLLAALFLIDLADSALKGMDHFRSFGNVYLPRQITCAAIALLAIFLRNRAFHAGLVLAALLGQVWWIWWEFDILDESIG